MWHGLNDVGQDAGQINARFESSESNYLSLASHELLELTPEIHDLI
jgi:hypothetical protein